MTTSKKKSNQIIMIGVISAIALVTALVFVSIAASSGNPDEEPTVITAATYISEIAPLLNNADAARGEALMQPKGCLACHVAETTGLGPNFEGIATRAQTERPPLVASAYLYEAIVYAHRYIVPGYTASMPNNYGEILSDAEIGDMVAYLLTLESS